MICVPSLWSSRSRFLLRAHPEPGGDLPGSQDRNG
jgi:hypothetical protein